MRDAIMAVLRRLDRDLDGVVWVITGSVGLALQGMSLEPRDVDLQTNEAGAYEIQRRLAAYTTRPVAFVARERTRSHWGAFVIDGIEVEVMGDIQQRAPDGEWDPAPDLPRLARWVEVDGLRVRVLPLAYEADAYRRMGRTEKAALIQAYADANATTDH
ncbi:MAG: hypothetical protein KIS91_02190 [Anaerolineae bacterium]|nr:hypothetical protein [Anaerolineae bacterium]